MQRGCSYYGGLCKSKTQPSSHHVSLGRTVLVGPFGPVYPASFSRIGELCVSDDDPPCPSGTLYDFPVWGCLPFIGLEFGG